MTRGKKSTGRKGLISAGRHDQAKKIAIPRTAAETYVNKVRAWKAGKRVMLTIVNPNKNETAKQMIRVRATDVWGFPSGKYHMAQESTSD